MKTREILVFKYVMKYNYGLLYLFTAHVGKSSAYLC